MSSGNYRIVQKTTDTNHNLSAVKYYEEETSAYKVAQDEEDIVVGYFTVDLDKQDKGVSCTITNNNLKEDPVEDGETPETPETPEDPIDSAITDEPVIDSENNSAEQGENGVPVLGEDGRREITAEDNIEHKGTSKGYTTVNIL